ncbi:hypothetical protein AA313_de0201470 [Arthrobotrys entomopaga]|nr:hypothetical protein AA313_de0201470 [Arthrobotrys entomopaga]
MNILHLPTELQEQILHYLPWHDHFLAASVCPLWQSLLERDSFRRKRHYDDLRDSWCHESFASTHGFVFNRQFPHRPDLSAEYGHTLTPCLHALLDRSALQLKLSRKADKPPKITMEIPKPDQFDETDRQNPKNLERDLEFTKYNISNSPLLHSDTVVFKMGQHVDYPVFDDRFAPPPVTLGSYKNSRVVMRVPLEYPIRLGGEKPQSFMGLLEDIMGYMRLCFEAKGNLEWVRATFIGLGRVHHTDEVEFEFNYGEY